MTSKTSVENDEEKKADMMKWADRNEERKKEHEQPLAMNLDKERESSGVKSLPLLYKKENEKSKNNIETFSA